jgi:hypothetical protein
MYLFCNSRTHIITLYSGHVCVYYASTLHYWYLVWILVRTDHPCLGVGCHNNIPTGAAAAIAATIATALLDAPYRTWFS